MMQAAPSTDTEKTTASRCAQSVAPPNPVSAAPPEHQKLARMQRALGNQAVLRMLAKSSPREGVGHSECSCAGSAASGPSARSLTGDNLTSGSPAAFNLPAGAECAKCALKRQASGIKAARAARDSVPPMVHEVLRSAGQPLNAGLRAEFEPRFAYDFSNVRIHSDSTAAESAAAVDALAYTAGRHIVFGSGQYAPTTTEGRKLIAHELAHVAQQGAEDIGLPERIGDANDHREREAERIAEDAFGATSRPRNIGAAAINRAILQRTPASKTTCGAGPLALPNGTSVADPVEVITKAETSANQLLDNAIAELDFTITQIRGGATIGFPTISDALGFGLRIMGLDPNSERVWKQDGIGTAALLLKRLRLIRGTIGSGSFFFVCLGPATGTIGTCTGTICGGGAFAASCADSFFIDLCAPFWLDTAAGQTITILHESSHNFAGFIQDAGREGNAECYARFAAFVGGTDVGGVSRALCPDPT